MKNIGNRLPGILFALVFVSTFAAGVARGAADDNTRDARVISARAGRVNFISGDVRLRLAGASDWRALTADDELKSGDTVTTGAGGRVEILLNPGSYFRAGAGAEFTLAEADLDDLRVELARGSAVVEATGYGDTELSIVIATPRSTVCIIRSGVYRVNALPDGAAEVAVFKGQAEVGGTLVKGGKLARTGAGGTEVSKLDKNNRDELDLWSRERGKELAKANEKLQRRTLNTLFARSSFDSLFGAYGPGRGFWFFNDRMRCYTFVPIGYGWRSPYGYWYETGVVIYGYGYGYGPGQWPQQGPPTVYNNPGGTNGGGGMTPSAPPPSMSVPERAPSTPRTESHSSDRNPRRDQR